MKTFLQVLAALCLLCDLSAQASLSEDFEAYNNGDLITVISTDWKLWPKGTDTNVSSEEAASGKNSMKLTGGKKTDLYYPFKRRFTAGAIQFSMDLFVPAGSNGYFSLQGEEQPGIVWSTSCYLDTTGYLRIVDDNLIPIKAAYPHDQWFKMVIDINFENHLWRFYVDDACVGSYIQTNPSKQSVAALALWPDGESSVFYVDNISFEHQGMAKALVYDRDAALNEIMDGSSERPRTSATFYAGINGEEQPLECLIKNLGKEKITSFELDLDTQGEVITQKYMVDLPADADTTVVLAKRLIYEGDVSSRLSLTKINGLTDENSCNNSLPLNLKGFTLHPAKKVWIEEATGTWCGWCPRGDIYMSYLADEYPQHFVGISVHYDDPMELRPWIGSQPKYKSRRRTESKAEEPIIGLQSFIKGFPSANVERTEVLDPRELELVFLERASQEPSATLEHSASWNEESRELEISITTNINKPLTEDMRLIVGLTEDNLSGEDDRWSQVNMYSGGNMGPMGGYEGLPPRVPAIEMSYNHVAKFLLTPFEGEAMNLSATPSEESRVVRNFVQRIPGDCKIENMHIVSGLIIGSAGVHNAHKSSITEALTIKAARN